MMAASRSGKDSDVSEKLIFLSHSGQQKTFAQYLRNELKRAHQKVFFDRDLEKGSQFPRKIIGELERCKLGVVVVSRDFVTSKWPMMELEKLVSQGTDLLPLFYGLHVNDLTSKEKLEEWAKEWPKLKPSILLREEHMQEGRETEGQVMEKWKAALRKLTSYNGLHYSPNTDVREPDYIDTVVACICKKFIPYPMYDQEHIQGLQPMVKEIRSHFDALGHNQRTCMVGLHGVAGSGKTALCQSIINFYIPEYDGRVFLMQLPHDCDELEFTEQCTEALKSITSLHETPIKITKSFNQVVALMKEHFSKNVFLAIDNVWAESYALVQRLLNVSFAPGSKILLTSRSEAILRELLSDQGSIHSLPALKLEDASKIFQQHVDRDGLTLEARNEIDIVLKRCRYDNEYHPKSLEALGRDMKRSLCGRRAREIKGSEWRLRFEEIDDAALQCVHCDIKQNYKRLKEKHEKDMFLDIAVWFRPSVCRSLWDKDDYIFKRTHANVARLLRFFYTQNFSEQRIDKHIYVLALAGVIRIEEDKYGEKLIGVHDLYVKLALKKARSKPSFFTSTEALETMECRKLKRVVSAISEGDQFIEEAHHQCEMVQYLYASDVVAKSSMHVELIPSLRVLILLGARPVFDAVIHIERARGLRKLEMLVIAHCPELKNLDCLEYWTELEALHVHNCSSLKKMPNLGGMDRLEKLTLFGNISLEEVGSLSPSLKLLAIENCRALKKLPVLGAMTCLETLTLRDNESLQDWDEAGLDPKVVKSVERCGAQEKSSGLFDGMTSSASVMRLERMNCSALEDRTLVQ